MKYFLFFSGLWLISPAKGQLMTWFGYDLYDYLAVANHPEGCVQDFVTGLPDDSTWVNLYDNTVMTGYFSLTWLDQPGNDLLLETSYHRDNYNVRLIKSGGSFSNFVSVSEAQWTQVPDIQWKHIFPVCNEGQAFSQRFIFPMDFASFGVGINEEVIGIEITFLPTTGAPDLAGVYIIVPPCGQLDLGPDKTVCAGETTDIDATTPGGTYVWQDGSTSAIYQDAGPGLYWVEVTIDDCTIADTILVVEATSSLDLGNDDILCEGEILVLDATTPGATYLWQDNSTLPTFTVTSEGTYWVQIIVNDCPFTDEINIGYNPLPEIEMGNDTSICDGESLILDVFIPGGSYLWQDNSTDPEFEVFDPGEYAVTVTVDGCSVSDEIEVSFTYLDQIELGDDVTLCHGEALELDVATPGASYEWQDNTTTSDYFVTEPGYYWVVVTVDNCSVTDDINIAYQDEIIFDLGEDVEICNGVSILLDATVNGATYEWQDNSNGSTLLADQPGIYFVEATVGECSENDTIEISFAQHTVALGPDQVLCYGETIVLEAFYPGASYLWQDNSDASTFTVDIEGIYHVLVNIDGCEFSDTVSITYVDNINIDLGKDTTLCTGASMTLDATTTGATYEWQDLSMLSTYPVTVPGTYWVNITAGGCTSTDTIRVEYLDLTTSFLGNDTTLCRGDSLILDALNAGANYLWQDLSTGPTLTVDQPGHYWVLVSLNHCSTQDSIAISYDEVIAPQLGGDTILCQNETLLLTVASPGSALEWHDLSTGNTFLVSSPGWYWVNASVNNCMATDSIYVSYSLLNDIDLGNDSTLCEGQTLLLNATTAGATYVWQDNSTLPFYEINQPGTFFVEVTDGSCTVADTVDIEYIITSVLDLGNDTILCDQETFLLDASIPGADSYLWQDSSVDPFIIVNEAGTYSVLVHIGQCQARDTVLVEVNSLVDINLGNDTTLCEGEILILNTLSPGSTFEWQDGSILPVFAVSTPGTYYVTVRLDQCEEKDSINIAYLDLSAINLGNDTTLCDGNSLSLNVQAPGAQYLWSDHSTAESLIVHDAGQYWVTINLDNCAASDTIIVNYHEPVIVSLGADTSLCPEASLVLDAETPGATYLWNDQSILPVYTVTQSGTFWVEVKVGNCSGRDTIAITYTSLPDRIFSADTLLCAGEELLLDAMQPGGTYVWQDASTSPLYLVDKPGVYSVKLKLDECYASDTIVVDFKTPLAFSLGSDQVICAGESLLLDPQINIPNVEYLWQNNMTAEKIEVSTEGIYWLQVKDECGISVDSIAVTLEDCSCHVYLPNAFSPNGDLINDELSPEFSCDITDYHFSIFDRSGGLLFETRTSGEGWNGYVNSQYAQVGVYVYVLTYTSDTGLKEVIHGNVTVIR